MFGYVTVYKPELKIKDYEAYRGIYCTLCKEMGREYGVFSRFLLSYDGAFYVLYKLGIRQENINAEKSRCTFNPCKKCLKITSESDIYKIASAITVILAYFKLIDNINDSKPFKKVMLYLLLPYFSLLKKRAVKKIPEVFETVQNGMNRQFEIEKEESIIPDKAADSTAKMLGKLFAYGECGEIAEKSEKLGYHLGRTVYFLDAFDDYKDDIKNGTFNPFSESYDVESEAKLAIQLSIGEISNILKELTINNFGAIAENIIYDGLNCQLEKITEKYRGDKNE